MRSALIGFVIVAGTLAAGSTAGAAAADDETPSEPLPPVTPEPPLRFTFTPGAWFARLGGDVRHGGRSITIEDEWRLNDLEPTINGELMIRVDDQVDLRFTGFDFSTTASGTIERGATFGGLTFGAGESFRSSFDITSLAGEIRFGRWPSAERFIRMPQNRAEDGRVKGEVRFLPTIGVRGVYLEHQFEVAGRGRERTRGTWMGLYGGMHFEITYRPDGVLPFVQELRLEGGGAIGPLLGEETGVLWQVHSGLTCMLTPNVGVMFGYRAINVDVEQDGFEFDGGLQGLFLAGTIRF